MRCTDIKRPDMPTKRFSLKTFSLHIDCQVKNYFVLGHVKLQPGPVECNK